MATKKQKREAALSKRKAFLERERIAGLEAQTEGSANWARSQTVIDKLGPKH